MAAMSETKLFERSKLDKKFLWNAESVFKDTAAWKAEYESVKAALPRLAARAGTLAAGGAKGLADTIELLAHTRAVLGAADRHAQRAGDFIVGIKRHASGGFARVTR